MMRSALFAALLLSGCATTSTPVEVTRFSLASDVVRGGFTVAPGTAPTLEQQRYDQAVARELSRAGFTAADSANARYVYSAEVTRDTRTGMARRSPVTIGVGGGVGGGTGGYGSGVGLGASFGLGGNRSGDGVVTRLSVRLLERAGGQVVWEGRAEGAAASRSNTISRSAAASPSDVVDRLAAALFRDFPGQSGRTISVP